jgi:SM-20-related protein
MAGYELLEQLGVFVRGDFFSPEEVALIGAEVDRAEKTTAGLEKAGEQVVIEEIRKTTNAEVSEATKKMVEERMRALQPELEACFDVSLSHYQYARFVVYRVGDFYRMHRDAVDADDELSSQMAKERKLTVVAYLDEQSETPGQGAFGGGELNLYGLMDVPGSDAFGLPVRARPGLLVAFDSRTLHEVKPITHGTRRTIVGCWA